MTDNSLTNAQKKQLVLREKRTEIISATPEKALDLIISDPTPAALIQSFPEEDLYFLVHHIGIADAISVLALADSEQWSYMVDVEVWGRDRLDNESVTEWLKILLVADSNRTVRWLINDRLEFIELYLFKNIEVIVREENQDPSVFPDDFFTYDDYFYIRISDAPEASEESGDIDAEERRLAIKTFIDTLVSIDIVLFQKVMLEASAVLPAETEEEEYRLRNVRLAEKGFMPFDEALEIFSPVGPDHFDIRPGKHPVTPPDDERSDIVPAVFMNELTLQNSFTHALSEVHSEADMETIRFEFASLCNQLISADKYNIKEKKELQGIVHKACGYLSLGMELLIGLKKSDPASLITGYGLKDIFRFGYGQVMELKWTAERFAEKGWFQSAGLPLSFWGEQWVGVLGGLLVERPLFYDNYRSGLLYREFQSPEDIHETAEILKTIRLFDAMLSAIAPELPAFSGYFLTSDNLLLTLWVHCRTGGDLSGAAPVTSEQFRPFFEKMWKPGKRDYETPGKIATPVKEDFLNWLSEASGFDIHEISELLAQALENMFMEIEKEYSSVSSDDIDPNLVYHFCLSR